MGVYNCKISEKLRRSVQSIIDQTFTDWEFLICDDGSTNETFLLLNKVREMDPRIKIFHYENNISLGNALNTCLEYAKGEYIARQDDDDDISWKDRFEKQVNFLDENDDYCMVGCCAQVYDENVVWGYYIVPEKPSKYDFLKNSLFMHPTMLMRRSALEVAGGIG